MSLNVLLVSDVMIKERTSIHGNIDPSLLYPSIKLAQDMYILPLLGSALFDKLISDVDSGTVAGKYEILLNKFVVDALIYYTLSELPETISYQFWNKGVMRKQNENSELPSMLDLLDLGKKYMKWAETYADRLLRYLNQNRNIFPEYQNPGNGIDTIYPKTTGFTSPIYLGDDEYCIERYKPYHE